MRLHRLYPYAYNLTAHLQGKLDPTLYNQDLQRQIHNRYRSKRQPEIINSMVFEMIGTLVEEVTPTLSRGGKFKNVITTFFGGTKEFEKFFNLQFGVKFSRGTICNWTRHNGPTNYNQVPKVLGMLKSIGIDPMYIDGYSERMTIEPDHTEIVQTQIREVLNASD